MRKIITAVILLMPLLATDGVCAYPSQLVQIKSGIHRRVSQRKSSTRRAYKGKMLFVRNDDVFVADLESGNVRQLIKNGRYPRWSPDQRSVLFTRLASRKRSRDFGSLEEWHLLRYDLRTGKTALITDVRSGLPMQASQSALDGSVIFKSTNFKGQPVLESAPTRHLRLPGYQYAWGPSLSDDGRWLAYWYCTGIAGDTTQLVVVVDMVTGKLRTSQRLNPRRLVYGCGEVSWSPSGKWLAATTADGDLLRVNIDGGMKTISPQDRSGTASNPTISFDGRWVAFDRQGSIWVGGADGMPAELLLTGAVEPCWQHAATRFTDPFLNARKKAALFVDAARRGDWGKAKALLDPDPSTSSISEIKRYRSALSKLPPSSEWHAEVSRNDTRNVVFTIHAGNDTHVLVVTPDGINKFYPTSGI